MDTIFMNSENSKISEHHVLVLKLANKLDLRRGQKSVALSNLSICYTWKNIKSSYNNNKFKISAPTWSDEFELPDGSYSISDIQDYFGYILQKNSEKNVDNLSIRIYVNKIENRITFKIKNGYHLGDQGGDYTTGCLLDYPYFRDSYKMIAVDLSKQHVLNADPRAIQQINFTANLDRAGNTRIYFILEEAKETKLDFSQKNCKSIVNMLYNNNIIISQLNKLKFAMKNETDVIIRLSSNMIGSSNDETNFPHKLLLPKRQVANPCKAFANHTSADIKFSRA